MLSIILISRLTTWLIVVTVLISSPVSADKLAEYFQRYELIYSAGANRIIKQNCLDTYKNYINSLLPGRETFFNSKCVTQTSTDPVTDIPSGRIAYEFQNVSATENRLKVTFTVIIGPNGLTVSQYSECGRYLAVTVENRALSLMNIPALTQTCNNIIGTWTKPADFETNPQHQGFTCDATEKKTFINHVMYCYPVVPGYITSINPDFTGKQVTLSWIPSSGVVTYYNVVFDGGNGDTRTQTSFTNTIMMTSLTPGRRYNITITAISGSMTSDPRYGTTMTTATESISEYTGAVAGSSVTVAVLISVAILIVIIIKRRKNKYFILIYILLIIIIVILD